MSDLKRQERVLRYEPRTPVPPFPDFPSAFGRLAYGKKRDLGWLTDELRSRHFVIYKKTAMSEQIETRAPAQFSEWESIWRRYELAEPKGAADYAARVREDLARRSSETERLRELGVAEAERLGETGVDVLQTLEGGLVAMLPRLVLLGGHGEALGIQIGKAYDVWFRDRDVIVTEASTRYALFAWPYGGIDTIEITGPGALTRGGGVIGGGFGVIGALEGMAIATIINTLTTRTTVKTVLRIESREAEVFLLDSAREPDDLRMVLSPVFGRLKRAARGDPSLAKGESHALDRLTQIADLFERGMLTQEEFDRAKTRLLDEL